MRAGRNVYGAFDLLLSLASKFVSHFQRKAKNVNILTNTPKISQRFRKRSINGHYRYLTNDGMSYTGSVKIDSTPYQLRDDIP